MTSKASPGNFFEDFHLGQVITHPVPRTITEGDNALYIALTGDRNPLHCDRKFARRIGYERELANDILVFNVIFGKTVQDISLNAVANLGYADVQFFAPVYPGDTLHSVSEVIGLKENSSRKDGIVYVHTRGINHYNERVCEFFRWVIVRKQDPNAACGEPVIPDLPDCVRPECLVVEDYTDFREVDASATGGGWFFDDYAVGERIIHGTGMTIEEAEHAMATRLYQNNAKVHFNAHEAQQRNTRRLVYGGHVISVAHALAHDGLENVLRILGWNGGVHANPVHAGDTIYALSEVLDMDPLAARPDAGALRLRLVAIKNLNPAEEPVELKTADKATGRTVYHPNVVLDLDYYVLVPRRTEG